MTPKELKRREDKKKEGQKKAYKEDLFKGLEKSFKSAVDNGSINSSGGRLKLSSFRQEDWQDIKAFFARLEWECNYVSQQDSSWSMTTKSECFFTNHFLVLTPKKFAK